MVAWRMTTNSSMKEWQEYAGNDEPWQQGSVGDDLLNDLAYVRVIGDRGFGK